MADEPEYIRDFKNFARAYPEFSDLPKLEAELYGANDRACAVMLGSIVDSSLEAFAAAKLRKDLTADDRRLLFDSAGSPLGTFSSRILIAHAFNLIGPETQNDLGLIRLIRNEFAHSRKSFDFSESTLKPICDRLKSPDWPGSYIPAGYLRIVPREELAAASSKTTPKTRYISACHIISERLLTHTGGVAAIHGVQDLP